MFFCSSPETTIESKRKLMKENRFTRLVGIKYPIIQAGMVWVSNWQLASECSKAGILGTLGTGSMTLEEVKLNIEKMRHATDRPFAVNIPMLRKDAKDIGNLCLDLGVTCFITSAGNPSKIVPILKKKGVILIHVVPSVKGAVKAQDAGADAIVCEGYEAGGHNSPLETTTLALVPQVSDAVKIPVVAAGGIADGRGIAAVMALGADGAQLGTRFIATTECQAHQHHKQMIVDSDDAGTCIIGRKLSMLRVLRNDFANKMEIAEKQGKDENALLEIIGDEFNRNRAASIEGDITDGTFQAGQSSGLVKDIIPVKELVQRLVSEFESAQKKMASL
jgi:enoyl-[acyl-carrier protein] reductase II